VTFYDNVCFENAFYTFNYIEIWFDEGLWVFKYVYEIRKEIWFDNASKNVYEIEKWDMFYKFYDELKISY
jgi:hypothetical protein